MIDTVFADSLIEILAKTCGVQMTVLSGEEDNGLFDVTGVINLNGKDGGILCISASKRDMAYMCARMTGEAADNITEDEIADTACELVNMTAGSVKLRLGSAGYDFNLTAPFALKSRETRIFVKKRTRVISVLLGGGDGGPLLKLKLF